MAAKLLEHIYALVFLRTALSGQGEGAARLLPEAVPT